MSDDSVKVVPWENDCLNRKDDAQGIQKYLDYKYQSSVDDKGFVLALNGSWGSGKTFLLTQWYEQAKQDKRAVIFFDAWKNDFSKEPFLAFISELDVALNSYFDSLGWEVSISRKLKEKWDAVKGPGAKVLFSAGLKLGIGMSLDAFKALSNGEDFDLENSVAENGKEAAAEASKNLKKIFAESLKKQKSHMQAMQLFKVKLQELVRALEEVEGIQLPLMIFIDELDRCRPTYAIELLEVIKHLFGVPGVYFVIGTNVTQLSHSVKAVYGEGFDGIAYLRRFFDQQYVLAEPSRDQFALELVSKIQLPNLNALKIERGHFMVPGRFEEVSNVNIVAFIFSEFSSAFKLSLRDMLQVNVVIEAAFSTFQLGDDHAKTGASLAAPKYLNEVHPILLIFLIILHQNYPKAYGCIKEYKYFHNFPFPYQTEKYQPEVPFSNRYLGTTYHPIEVCTASRVNVRSLDLFEEVENYFRVLREDAPDRGFHRPDESAYAEFFEYRGNFELKVKYLDNYFQIVDQSARFQPILRP